MKFGIFTGSNAVPIHARTLEERPLGGTETGVICLALELASLGHEVLVFSGRERSESLPSNPQYLPLEDVERVESVDVFISLRDWIPLFYRISSRLRFLWTGDSYDQLANFGIGDRRISEKMNGILAVSDWQANALSRASGFPREKIHVIRNGIRPELFVDPQERVPGRMIYSSTPYRGLEFVPAMINRVREKVPEAHIEVYSGYRVYNQNEANFEPLQNILRQTEGVVLKGNTLQAELSKAFLRSWVLFYPNIFEETSCITAIEAMAAGCVPVSSTFGALPETIGDAGVLIEGHPSEPHYQERFIEASVRLLSDLPFWKSFSEKGQARARELTWRKTAERLLALIQSL